MMKTKTFDCVEMKHKGAQRIMDEIKKMTSEEQLNYWKKATEEFRTLQRQKGKEQKQESVFPIRKNDE